jgi:hypothetical protein
MSAAVGAAAGAGDYGTIARLAASGVWQPGDLECTLAGLLRAASLHDVNCRRALAAAVTRIDGTRGRALLRGAPFVDAYGRTVAAGLTGLDEALRLLRMGAAPWMLAETALRHAPQWGGDMLRALPDHHTLHARCIEACSMALDSPRPAALLPTLLAVGGLHSRYLLSRLPGNAPDVELMERIAAERDLLCSGRAGSFVRHILDHACRVGSEPLLAAVEAIPASAITVTTYRERAAILELCRQRSPHLVDRVAALPWKCEGPGLMSLVAYGAQAIHPRPPL